MKKQLFLALIILSTLNTDVAFAGPGIRVQHRVTIKPQTATYYDMLKIERDDNLSQYELRKMVDEAMYTEIAAIRSDMSLSEQDKTKFTGQVKHARDVLWNNAARRKYNQHLDNLKREKAIHSNPDYHKPRRRVRREAPYRPYTPHTVTRRLRRRRY